MFRQILKGSVVIIFVMLLLVPAQAVAQEHPKMLFNQSDIASLRSQANGSLKALKNQIVAHANEYVGSPPAQTRDMYAMRQYGGALITMAFSWVLTGDVKYLNSTRSWLLAFADWTYWDMDPDIRGLALSDMLIGNALAFDWIYSELTAAERTKIRDKLAAQTKKMYDASMLTSYNSSWANWWSNTYVQNHCLIDYSALGVASLVLEGEISAATTYLNQAKRGWTNIKAVLDNMADSSWSESTQYGAYAFSKAIIFFHSLKKAKGVDLTPDTFFKNYSIWRAYNFIPGSLNLAVPTGDFGWDWNDPTSPAILRFCARKYRDGRAQWLATEISNILPRTSNSYAGPNTVIEFLNYDSSVAHVPPSTLRTYARFDDMEGVIWRSGWSTSDFIFTFKTGAYGGRKSYDAFRARKSPWSPRPSWGMNAELSVGHNHDDQHSFFIHYNGTWVAPEHTEYGKNHAKYHNSILIDGQGQFRPQDDHYNNHPYDGNRSDGWLEQTVDFLDHHYLIADGKFLYSQLSDVQNIKRFILYIKPRTVLIVDLLQTGNARTFEWVSHFTGNPSKDGDWIRSAAGPNLFGVQQLNGSSMSVTFGNDGSPYMRTRNASKANKVVMAHLLHAMPGGTWASRPQGELIDNSGEAVMVTITNSDGTSADVFINYAGTTTMKTAGSIRTDAKLAVVERFANGKAKRMLVFGGTRLYESGGSTLLADGLERTRAYILDQSNTSRLKVDYGQVR